MIPGPVRMLRPAFPTVPRGACTKWALEGVIVLPFRSTYPLAAERHVGSARSATLLNGALGLPILGRAFAKLPVPNRVRARSCGNPIERGEGLAGLHGSNPVEVPPAQNRLGEA